MRERGFTLVEVLTALGLLVTAALASAQLLVITERAIHTARVKTSATTLASSQMEKLRADPRLAPSPASSLDGNVDGYVDFADAEGNWIGGFGSAPPGAAYVCRWSVVEPRPDVLVIQVLVRSIAEDAARERVGRGEARLVTVRTRRLQ